MFHKLLNLIVSFLSRLKVASLEDAPIISNGVKADAPKRDSESPQRDSESPKLESDCMSIATSEEQL